MPVTFDNSAKGVQTATVNNVCSMVIAANAVLLVGVVTKGVTTSISACVANGVALTQLGRQVNDGGPVTTTLYGLTAPPSGTVSISAAPVGGGSTAFNLYAASYLGAKATNPFGTVISGSAGAVTNFVISLSTSSTDMVIFFAGGVNVITAMNATTRQFDNNDYGVFWADTAGSSAAISLSASAVATVQNISFMGLNIAFSAAASTFIPGLAMMGCGQ